MLDRRLGAGGRTDGARTIEARPVSRAAVARARELFDQAMERHPGVRLGYLRQACEDDPDLLLLVLRLVQVDVPSDFLSDHRGGGPRC